MAAAQRLGFQHPIYAMIAAVIVTDLSPLQTRKLGVVRLAGTVLGTVAGAALSSLLKSGPWLVGLSIFAAMILSHVLHLQHAAKVAGYVCGIVVLDHGSEPWVYALHRMAETFLGITLALLVSFIPKLLGEEDLQDS
jgi:uncharacterized membrane protein YgaE (UPF0421/DUF939 family)